MRYGSVQRHDLLYQLQLILGILSATTRPGWHLGNRSRYIYAHCAVLFSLLSSACAETQDTFDGVEVSDSAGITIMTYRGLDTLQAESIHVSATPIFRIGLVEGGEEFEDLVDAAFVPGGEIIVADGGGTQQLVRISPDGRIRGRWGRTGEGPGEYQRIYSLVVGDAGIFVQDLFANRVTHLSLDGSVLDSYQGVEHGNTTLLGVDGDIAFFGPPRVRGNFLADTPWISASIVRLKLGTRTPLTAGNVEYAQSINFGGKDPFVSQGFVAVSRGRWIATRADRPEIRILSSEGRTVQITRWEQDAQPVSEALWDEYSVGYAEFMSGRVSPADIASILRSMREVSAGVLPLFNHLLTDPFGRTWLGEFASNSFARPGPEGRRYQVFDSDGSALGSVYMPSARNFTLVAIGTDRIVGFETDELDREGVAVYSLDVR